MRRRPWIIVIIAFMYMIEPLFRFALFYIVHGITPVQLIRMHIQMDNILYLLSFFLLPFAGIAIYAYKKWSLFYFMLIQFVVLILNLDFLIELFSQSFQFKSVFYVSIYALQIFVTVYFLLPVVRRTFFDYSVQWWHAKPRFLLRIPVQITQGENSKAAEVVNISQTGIFLQISGFTTGQVFALDFTYEDFRFQLKARTVFVNNDKTGIGAEFIELTRADEKSLKRFCQMLLAKGVITRTGQVDTLEDLKTWIKGLTRGEGLFPKY